MLKIKLVLNYQVLASILFDAGVLVAAQQNLTSAKKHLLFLLVALEEEVWILSKIRVLGPGKTESVLPRRGFVLPDS